jgi:hypothetical protein
VTNTVPTTSEDLGRPASGRRPAPGVHRVTPVRFGTIKVQGVEMPLTVACGTAELRIRPMVTAATAANPTRPRPTRQSSSRITASTPTRVRPLPTTRSRKEDTKLDTAVTSPSTRSSISPGGWMPWNDRSSSREWRTSVARRSLEAAQQAASPRRWRRPPTPAG